MNLNLIAFCPEDDALNVYPLLINPQTEQHQLWDNQTRGWHDPPVREETLEAMYRHLADFMPTAMLVVGASQITHIARLVREEQGA
mgnify:CR=1 FL=1